MLLSINWLKDYIDLNLSDREIADGLTNSGSHVESIIYTGQAIENVVVGRIEEIKAHENADKLVVCSVNVGDEILQIVTGAKNVFEGAYVPVAKVGAVLAGDFKIKKSKLRGVESFGMLCSLEELGFSDSVIPKASKDGIHILSDKHDLGRNIIEALELEDAVLELEITPNRPDCLSILGMAREASATFDLDLKEPKVEIKNQLDNIKDYLEDVKIESEKCNRYYLRVIKDVKIGRSPEWIENRLMSVGIRPINNIVDVTNLVMAELGQPLHGFDLDKIESKSILVREGKEGEVFTSLDGVERKISQEDIMITDGQEPLAIGGIMGGLDSEVTDSTKTVLLESANFDKSSIRLSSRRFNLRSEASAKFEKGIDPNLVKLAGDRACQIIEEIGAGTVVEGFIDIKNFQDQEVLVDFRPERARKILSIDLEDQVMANYFKRLGLGVEIMGDNFKLSIPSFRKDLRIEEDLIEEVGRLYNFSKIEPKALKGSLTSGKLPIEDKIGRLIKNSLTSFGMKELLTYSFISPKAYDKLNLREDDPTRDSIKILNPLGEDYSVMRKTILPNHLDVYSRNIKMKVESSMAYEIGNVFSKGPVESSRLVLGGYGDIDFYKLKDIINKSLARLGIYNLEYKPLVDSSVFHPGRAGQIYLDGEILGQLGEVHPDVLSNYSIRKRVYLGDLDMDMIIEKTDLKKTYSQIARYPAIDRDLAIILDEDILVGDVEKLLRSHGEELVEEVKLFDLYQGDQIEEGKKSVAYSIRYRAKDRTLVEEEIEKIQKSLIKDIEEKLGGRLRS